MQRITVVSTLILALSCATPGQDRPPNVVLILADDLGYGDPGCFNPESKIPTPHIDRLAAEGTRFTDAHSPASVCTPTRYGLLTGRYAWRTALKRSVLWPWDPPLLEPERVTLPELLKTRGFSTACIGKWHLGWDWPLDGDKHVVDVIGKRHTWAPDQRAGIAARVDWTRPVRGGPLAHGFDTYFGDDVPNFPPYGFIEDDRLPIEPTTRKPAGMFGHDGPATPGWDLSTVMPMIAQRAAAWIDGRRSAPDPAQPFFLYVPLTAPHTPIAPTPRFAGRSQAGPYGDFVAEVDWVVGQISAALQRGGFSEDTIVIFTSDNGSPHRTGKGMAGPTGSIKKATGHDPSAPFRGMKSDAWEAGHRVPFVARWPERIPAGKVCAEPMIHTDLYRTLATLTGSPMPWGAAEDGFDLSKVWLKGAGAQPVRDHLVHHSGNGTFAIRVGRWKLILGKGSGGFTRFKPAPDAPPGQLYDLTADPKESVNRYAEHPEIVQRLTARLRAIQRQGHSRR